VVTVEFKTAKDLPAGAEVTGGHTEWLKDRPGHQEPWSRKGDGAHIGDGTMDRLLAEGAHITFIPSRPTLPMVAACGVCRDWHYNACPVHWGGQPEMVEPVRRLPLGVAA
jgi:hypothetical protein